MVGGMPKDADHKRTWQKGKKKQGISEPWQSALCYFPGTVPKHFAVFFCTRARTLQSPTEMTQPIKQAVTLAHRTRSRCGTQAELEVRDTLWPKETILPSPGAVLGSTDRV